MGREYRRQRREEKCIQNLSGNLKGRENSEDTGIDGRIILELILWK
jgi:hypothetical protein